MRVAEFVEKLFFNDVGVNASTGARVFGDSERAVGFHFDDGVADGGHVGNRLPVYLAVASGALRAAFDDVAGDRSRREFVPVVGLPAEFVNHGSEREGGVGGAACDDHIRAGVERLGQGERPDVGVCREDAGTNSANGFVCIHVAHLVALAQKFVDPVKDVVTVNHRDVEPGRGCQHGVRAGHGIDATGIGHHLDIALAKPRGEAADQGREVACVAELWVLLLLLLQDGHGDFGEIVEDQEVDGTFVDEADGGFQPVAPKTLAISDADHWEPR